MEPMTALHPGMRFVDAEGKLLLDWPRPQGTGPQGWRANYRFHQPDLEKILRDSLVERPSVTVRTRCDAFYVADEGDHVEIRFEDMSCGKIERVSAKYVVGCDVITSYSIHYTKLYENQLVSLESWLTM